MLFLWTTRRIGHGGGAILRSASCRIASALYSTTATTTPVANVDARKKGSEPLRILFCGSDEFSCAAFRALHAEKQRNARLVEAIDVVVRPDKAVGRYLQRKRSVPLKQLVQERYDDITLHEHDSFAGWTPPLAYNLVVAVSFGLFIPARILRRAAYGGLNLHPSLLPDLRGGAPLHHTLLQGRSHIGITLQTLDEARFDHGLVLAQTPSPGLAIPAWARADVASLMSFVSPPAAEMLVQGLRDGAHVPPLRPVGWQPTPVEAQQLTLARRLTKEDQRVSWRQWTAADVERRARVFGGRLWTNMMKTPKPDKKGKSSNPTTAIHVVLHDVVEETSPVDPDSVTLHTVTMESPSSAESVEVTYLLPNITGSRDSPKSPTHAWIRMPVDDSLLRVESMTASGKPKSPAWQVLQNFHR